MATIIIDSREKNPLVFRKFGEIEGTKVGYLNVGDYSLEGYENKIAIERKEIGDLFGTLGRGHKRFRAELERAKPFEFFAIVIESPFNLVLEKSWSNAQFSKMKGYVVAQILCTLIVKYGIHVFFCNNRNEASSLIRNLFKAYLKTKKVKDVSEGNNSLPEEGKEVGD
jgi:DNA excision repair protein ERCC-4